LVEKDREIQEFLDAFEKNKSDAMEHNFQLNTDIENLLGQIHSLSSTDTSALPSKEEHNALRRDLNFKQTEVERADTTIEALIRERDQKMQDLEKVDQLEVKITIELKNLTERIAGLKNEIDMFDNSEDSKTHLTSEIEVKYYITQKKKASTEWMQEHSASLNESLSALTVAYDAKRSQLLENETFTQLSGLEQRVKHLEGVAFEFRDCIA
jgi:intraflagellar transport protein 74